MKMTLGALAEVAVGVTWTTHTGDKSELNAAVVGEQKRVHFNRRFTLFPRLADLVLD